MESLSHKLLEFIEEQNLSEGEYLIACKILKDAFKKLNSPNGNMALNKKYMIECITNRPFLRVVYEIVNWIILEDEDDKEATIEYKRVFDNGKGEVTTYHSTHSLQSLTDEIVAMSEAIQVNVFIVTYEQLSQTITYQDFCISEVARLRAEYRALGKPVEQNEGIKINKWLFYKETVNRLESFLQMDGFDVF